MQNPIITTPSKQGITHPLDALPFVSKIDRRHRDFWHVHPSGCRGSDYRQGEDFARQYVEYMKAHRQRYLLGWMVRDMIRHQQPSSIELGFMWHLSGVVMERRGGGC